MQVAQTILAQLGGTRFSAMTGAKSFVSRPDTLSFRLPSRFAKNGINAVAITLAPTDTYDMHFFNIRGVDVKNVASETMIYADQLRQAFTRITGLDTNI